MEFINSLSRCVENAGMQIHSSLHELENRGIISSGNCQPTELAVGQFGFHAVSCIVMLLGEPYYHRTMYLDFVFTMFIAMLGVLRLSCPGQNCSTLHLKQ